MSDELSQNQTVIEQRVIDMLARRAADISADPEEASRPLPIGQLSSIGRHPVRRRWRTGRRRWLAAAAVVVVVGGGLIAFGQRQNRDSRFDPSIRIETGADDDSGGSVGESDRSGAVDATDEDIRDVTVADVVALLPDGLDVRSASMLQLGRGATTDPLQAAEDYLAVRLPDLTVTISPAGNDDTLHLFRWSVDDDGFSDVNASQGWVFSRVDPGRVGVVAAITDGVDLVELSRVDRRLSATVTHNRDTDLFADITDPSGRTLASGVEKTQFGTAGSSNGAERLDVEAEIPPWPVALRLQHVGGTFLSITEVVLEPGGFSTSCGLTPPVSIDVGDRLGPIESGPVGATSRDSVANQQVWHHAGTNASKQTALEIRWPPDPDLVGRLRYEAIGADTIARFATGVPLEGSSPGDPWTGESHTLLALGDNGATDPCDLVQLSVLGDPETAAWWSGALGGEWSFDLPLTVATDDLDPLANFDDVGAEDTTGSGGELIVEVREGVDAADIPQVPPVGSCDGLPNDPPRTGAVPETFFGSPDEALADFVQTIGVAEDPPLATDGYVEYRSANDSARRYVIESDGRAFTVVEVDQTDGEWHVTRWEASVC